MINIPHGKKLKNLLVNRALAKKIKKEAVDFPRLKLNERQLCDLELLINGGFSPLEGYLDEEDYYQVLEKSRLSSGELWPIPIVLDVPNDFKIKKGESIILTNDENIFLALLRVESVYTPDKIKEALTIYGTKNNEHPGVAYLNNFAGEKYLGGKIEGIMLPPHYDFIDLRKTPRQLRRYFAGNKWRNVVSFQTRNPMHRVHFEITVRAARDHKSKLLIHPVVGPTKEGDVDYITRIRCYRIIQNKYRKNSALVSLLPLAMRMAGPREALWHAIIRKNYGCSHFIVGRDHAGPGTDSKGRPFYEPLQAQDFAVNHQDELGMNIIPFGEMAYSANHRKYYILDEMPKRAKINTISGTQFREKLASGEGIPDWFSFPEVITELRKTFPPKHERGIVIFFTGLSGSGKSTIANILHQRLLENEYRKITLLDGDIVRQNLSKGLGFSKEDRDANILRIGFVASEIAKNGGIAICAAIAPYEEIRRKNRDLVASIGANYIEVYVSTPLSVCKKRDLKGLYAKAEAGLIKNFTGIDDPYEKPKNPEIVMNAKYISAKKAAEQIIKYLLRKRFINQ